MTSPPTSFVQPFHFTQQQPLAETVERDHHKEVLYAYGEYAIFVLLWHPDDFDAGLVERCPTCFTSYGRAAEAYGQSAKNLCEDCFGTTFEGGFRAKIIRPAIFTDHQNDNVESARGSLDTDSVTMETTSDFTLQRGDWVIRSDNDRFAAQAMSNSVIRSGFGEPTDDRAVGSTATSLRLQDDKVSAAYLVPPTDPDDVYAILHNPPGTHTPRDFSTVEVIRGPLIVGT